jgi:hypothetical protein
MQSANTDLFARPAHRARTDRDLLDGGRQVNVPDPDGNAIAFAEPPDGASASPRSAGTGASS